MNLKTPETENYMEREINVNVNHKSELIIWMKRKNITNCQTKKSKKR